MSCWNGVIESEKQNEVKMLQKVELFPKKTPDGKVKNGADGKTQIVPQLDRLAEYVEALVNTDVSKI